MGIEKVVFTPLFEKIFFLKEVFCLHEGPLCGLEVVRFD